MEWGPDVFVLPDGSAIAREDRPCRCGCREFVVIETPDGFARYAVWCRECHEKRKRKAGERVVGHLDMTHWRIVPIRKDEAHEPIRRPAGVAPGGQAVRPKQPR